jgi:tetratricopeptide (TPR) repeat protein
MLPEKIVMNSIGARQSAVACVKRHCFLILAAVCTFSHLRAADCDAGLSSAEKVNRFKQLDAQGESAMQQHRPQDAIAAYKEATCLVPNSARAFYGLGMAEANARKWQDARQSFMTADRLQPDTPMPLVMQVRVNYSAGDLDALKSNLRDLAARFPRDVSAHTAVARFLAEHNFFVLALAEALRTGRDSDDWNSRIQVAILENTVGAYSDAVRTSVAVEQNRNVPDAARGAAAGVAGLSYESLGKTQEAEKYLQEAIQLDPAQENSYLALADLFEQEQKYTDAVTVLQRARKNVPDSPAVQLALGSNLIRAEQYEPGVTMLRSFLRRAPDTADAYISLADAYRKTGKAEEEVRALRDLARYHPDYPNIHLLLARAIFNQQPPRYSDVLSELAAAEKASPNNPDIYSLRGKTYVALGRFEEAKIALERSIALQPTDPARYYELARLYRKLGQSELARQQFARVKYLEQSGTK